MTAKSVTQAAVGRGISNVGKEWGPDLGMAGEAASCKMLVSEDR